MTQKLKVTELSQEQLSKLPEYAKLGIDIGLKADPSIDEPRVKELINKHLTMLNLNPIPEKNFIFMDSPMAVIKKYGKYCNYNNALYGQHDSYWLVFYAFFRLECGLIEETNSIVHLLELSKHVGWFWVSSDTAIVTRRPSKIHLSYKARGEGQTDLGVLHKPEGLALEYIDGTGVYASNGVRIPKEYEWIITTPAGELSLKKVLGISNVEIRNEALKKIGKEAYMNPAISKVVNTYTCMGNGGDYSLYEVDLNETVKRKYLHMVCPSSGEEKFEAVPPEITTCTEALNWRQMGVLGMRDYTPPIIRA